MDDLAKKILDQYTKRFKKLPTLAEMALIERLSAKTAAFGRLGRWVVYRGHKAYRLG